MPALPGLNPYETDKLLSEYLLFHYGRPEEILTGELTVVDRSVLDYPARCVSELVDLKPLGANARALDLGCAVGRSSFELARHCGSVVGIDFSKRFIETAQRLREDGRLAYQRIDEGTITTPLVAVVPAEIDRSRIHFEVGDATDLRDNLGNFDIVFAANLLCRLPVPVRLLERLPGLVKPGGQLVLTTPCTWLDDFTPPNQWIGATPAEGTTLEALQRFLSISFELVKTKDLPFLIREHRRKYQLSVALGSVWRRR